MRYLVVLTAMVVGACAPSGYVYEVGNFVRPHPTQATCASRGQVLDMTIEDCVTPVPSEQSRPAPTTVAQINAGETYEGDRAWSDRIAKGACSRSGRTDAPADIAECARDYASGPPCMSYKGFALAYYDIAERLAKEPPPPGVDMVASFRGNIDRLGTPPKPEHPPHYYSQQFRDALHRLFNVAFSPERKKWSTQAQFAEQAYKRCMEGRPF